MLAPEVRHAPTRIRVGGEAPYDVVVGADVTTELPGLLGPSVLRVAVIHPAALVAVAAPLVHELTAHGYRVTPIEVPEAEDAKTSRLLRGRGLRSVVPASPAATPSSGSAAARQRTSPDSSRRRGCAVSESSWYPPRCSGWSMRRSAARPASTPPRARTSSARSTLRRACSATSPRSRRCPTHEYVSGLAEVVKAGFIADPAILDLIEDDPAAAVDSSARPCCASSSSAPIRVKAAVVVAGDLARNGVGREILNYGHTLGHAIEKVEHYRWRHGNAVSVGMVFAAELGRLAGRLDDATADRHRAILQQLGTAHDVLPVPPGPRCSTPCRSTRRPAPTGCRFIVLDGLARPGLLEAPDPALLAEAARRASRGRERAC